MHLSTTSYKLQLDVKPQLNLMQHTLEVFNGIQQVCASCVLLY